MSEKDGRDGNVAGRPEGRLGVVNDFTKRSQIVSAWLGGVRINTSLCRALENQPVNMKDALIVVG